MVPLVAFDPFGTTTRVLLNAYELVGVALGLFIAYQAYRGYKRNQSRPMLFISLGFILILGPPALLFAFVFVDPNVPLAPVKAAIQTFEIAGLLCIIHSFRMEP